MQTDTIDAWQVADADLIVNGKEEVYLVIGDAEEDGDYLRFNTTDEDGDTTQFVFAPFDSVTVLVSWDDPDD